MTLFRLKILLGFFFLLILSERANAQQKTITGDCDRLKISYEVKAETHDRKNGEIKLTIKGGKAPYTVQWIAHDFSKKGEHIQNLKAGFYTAVVYDTELCIKQIDNIQVGAQKK